MDANRTDNTRPDDMQIDSMETDTDLGRIVPPPTFTVSVDAYTTPPMQTNQMFDPSKPSVQCAHGKIAATNNSTDKKYAEIQNLPTPLVSNNMNGSNYRRNSNANSLNSPTFSRGVFPIDEDEDDSTDSSSNFSNHSNAENMSIPSLRFPKVRQRNANTNNMNPIRRNNLEMKNILVDKNAVNNCDDNVRYFSEYRMDNNRIPSTSPTVSSYDDMSRRSNTSTDSRIPPPTSSFLKDIRPVDRVVSLPFPFRTNNNHSNTTIDAAVSVVPPSDIKSEDVLPRIIELHSIEEPIRHQYWTIVKEIGEGSFSKVYLTDDGETAIKITNVKFNKDGLQSDELQLRIKNSLSRELEILKLLRHPNIIKLVATDYEPGIDRSQITMALEYCHGGDLFSFILENRPRITCELVRVIFSNIVSAVSYMHAGNVCHRDIKLENLLLKYDPETLIANGVSLVEQDHEPIIILSDFGLSKKLDIENPMLSTRCGSEDYVSPELLLGMPYDGKQNDCWSLGVVLYTLLENRLPFDPIPGENVKRNAKPAHRIAMISWSWYVMKDSGVEFDDPKRIVKKLLCKKNKRADIEEIKNDPWCQPYVL